MMSSWAARGPVVAKVRERDECDQLNVQRRVWGCGRRSAKGARMRAAASAREPGKEWPARKPMRTRQRRPPPARG